MNSSVIKVHAAEFVHQLDNVTQPLVTSRSLADRRLSQTTIPEHSTVTVFDSRLQTISSQDGSESCHDNFSTSSKMSVDDINKASSRRDCVDNSDVSYQLDRQPDVLSTSLFSVPSHLSSSPTTGMDCRLDKTSSSPGCESTLSGSDQSRQVLDNQPMRLQCSGGTEGCQPLRRVRSKSVLLPPTSGGRQLARLQPRGSLQADLTRHKMSLSDVISAIHGSSTSATCATIATQTKSVQTYVSYAFIEKLRSAKELHRKASLATTRSQTHSVGRDSTMSEVFYKCMRLNGTVPKHCQSRSVQSSHQQQINEPGR